MVVNRRLELYCSIVTSVTSWTLILTLIRFASTALAPLYGRNGVTSAGIDKDGWTGQDGTGPSDSGTQLMRIQASNIIVWDHTISKLRMKSSYLCT